MASERSDILGEMILIIAKLHNPHQGKIIDNAERIFSLVLKDSNPTLYSSWTRVHIFMDLDLHLEDSDLDRKHSKVRCI